MTENDLTVADQDATHVLHRLLSDPGEGVSTIFERIGGRIEGWRAAGDRFKAAVATLSATLGPVEQTPTRKQGIAKPPHVIDPRWTKAAIWFVDGRMVCLTLSGSDSTIGCVELTVGRSR